MRGYLTLGSNQGDPARQISNAMATLPTRGVEVLAVSSFYETDPVGEVTDQPLFLNGAARIETDLAPEELLTVLKQVECEAGRELENQQVDGPRPLDLDIALLEGIEHASERLTVPHPRLLERRFALIPLLELDFELATPDGTRLSDALAELPVAGSNVQLVQ